MPSHKHSKNGQQVLSETSRAAQIASEGISTFRGATNYLTALVADHINGHIPNRRAATSCNLMGKVLKSAEHQIKYGPDHEISDPVQGAVGPDPVLVEEQALRARLAELETVKASRNLG